MHLLLTLLSLIGQFFACFIICFSSYCMYWCACVCAEFFGVSILCFSFVLFYLERRVALAITLAPAVSLAHCFFCLLFVPCFVLAAENFIKFSSLFSHTFSSVALLIRFLATLLPYVIANPHDKQDLLICKPGRYDRNEHDRPAVQPTMTFR